MLYKCLLDSFGDGYLLEVFLDGSSVRSVATEKHACRILPFMTTMVAWSPLTPKAFFVGGAPLVLGTCR